MLRHTILFVATLLAFHASARADKNSEPPPAEAAVAPIKPKTLCTGSEKLERVAQRLADREQIPPSSELIQTAREEGIDANPIYAKFGVTGEVSSFKAWVADLLETADPTEGVVSDE